MMANNIKIYILNWNGGHHLHNCIDSIKMNKTDNYKIIVIDNNSSDSSIENLSNDIETIKLNENFGFGVGYNKGIFQNIEDNDDYIVLLNYDTIVTPDFVASILKEVNKKGKNYIYGAKILYHDKNNLIWYGGGALDLSNGIISHRQINTPDTLGKESSFTDFITGCCMIIHKDVFKQLGGFDSRFFMYNEDVDFCLRAKAIGINCIYAPSIKLFHKVSLSLGGNYSIKKITKKLKSTFILYNKYYQLHKSIPLFIFCLLKSTMRIKYYQNENFK
mgnify:CR=1 FL=1